MNAKAIIGVSILAVVLIVLGSQSNVVGYQTVQSSVKERLNEKDLLFQTICDLANNKEVQKTILESQGMFQNPFPTSQLTSFPSITKRQLNLVYHLGVALSEAIGKARIALLVKNYPINLQTPIRINATLRNNSEIEGLAQLSSCQCNSPKALCKILWVIYSVTFALFEHFADPFNVSLLRSLVLIPFAVVAFLSLYLYLVVFDCPFWPPLID